MGRHRLSCAQSGVNKTSETSISLWCFQSQHFCTQNISPNRVDIGRAFSETEANFCMFERKSWIDGCRKFRSNFQHAHRRSSSFSIPPPLELPSRSLFFMWTKWDWKFKNIFFSPRILLLFFQNFAHVHKNSKIKTVRCSESSFFLFPQSKQERRFLLPSRNFHLKANLTFENVPPATCGTKQTKEIAKLNFLLGF